jgi:hypothetical protein
MPWADKKFKTRRRRSCSENAVSWYCLSSKNTDEVEELVEDNFVSSVIFGRSKQLADYRGVEYNES